MNEQILKSFLTDPFAGHDLTEEESEAARLIAKGLSWSEAEEKLKISRVTLAKRLNRACKKLHVDTPKGLTIKLFELLDRKIVIGGGDG